MREKTERDIAVIIRPGKTRRDMLSGAKARNAANKAARNEYCQDSKMMATNAHFPFYACNGRKNRYRVTGKDGVTLFLRDNSQNKRRT